MPRSLALSRLRETVPKRRFRMSLIVHSELAVFDQTVAVSIR